MSSSRASRAAHAPLTLAAILVAATAAPARADDPRAAALIELAGFRGNIEEANRRVVWPDLSATEQDCRAAIARGNAAGVPPTAVVDTGHSTFPWKDAPAVCAEYGRYHALDAAIATAKTALVVYFTFSNPALGGARVAGSAADGAACVAKLDAAIAAGAPTDVSFDVGYRGEQLVRATIVEARALCADYAAWSKRAAVEIAAEAAAAAAALRAKYTQHGITGDRLAYLIANGHRPVLGRGCGALDLQGQKTAPALYDLGQSDRHWIVYKTEFKKDRKVRESTRRFSKLTQTWACK